MFARCNKRVSSERGLNPPLFLIPPLFGTPLKNQNLQSPPLSPFSGAPQNHAGRSSPNIILDQAESSTKLNFRYLVGTCLALPIKPFGFWYMHTFFIQYLVFARLFYNDMYSQKNIEANIRRKLRNNLCAYSDA